MSEEVGERNRQAGGKAVLVVVVLFAWLAVFGANAPMFIRTWNDIIGVENSDATFTAGYITLSVAPLIVIGVFQFIRGEFSAE